MTFGKQYQYCYGEQFRVAFLTQERTGALVFGTEHGGRMRFSEAEFQAAISDGLLVEL